MERQKRLKVTAHLVTGIVILAALALGIVGTVYGVGATNSVNSINGSQSTNINKLQASIYGDNGQSNDSSSALFNIATLQQQNQDQELKISALNTNMNTTMTNLVSVTSVVNANTALLAQTATPLKFLAVPTTGSFSPVCNAANKNNAWIGITPNATVGTAVGTNTLSICDGISTFVANGTSFAQPAVLTGVPVMTSPGQLYLGLLATVQTCVGVTAGTFSATAADVVAPKPGDLGKYAKLSTVGKCATTDADNCSGVCMCDGTTTPKCIKVY